MGQALTANQNTRKPPTEQGEERIYGKNYLSYTQDVFTDEIDRTLENIMFVSFVIPQGRRTSFS